jgi:hypothetical protein
MKAFHHSLDEAFQHTRLQVTVTLHYSFLFFGGRKLEVQFKAENGVHEDALIAGAQASNIPSRNFLRAVK